MLQSVIVPARITLLAACCNNQGEPFNAIFLPCWTYKHKGDALSRPLC